MFLAGDIGGTKTLLACYHDDFEPVVRKRYRSQDFDSLEAILRDFLDEHGVQVQAATFGVAGPIRRGVVDVMNLPWMISEQRVEQTFGIPKVTLINDVLAAATAVPFLQPDQVTSLSAGVREPRGVKAVVAPGTGLGEAFLVFSGDHYQAFPSEGGHASFAPNTREEVNLLAYLEKQFGHVSCERVCSGSGVANIYRYLRDQRGMAEPAWLREEMEQGRDPVPAIVRAGLEKRADICMVALDMLIRILGGVVGNTILKVLATGGLYLAGGMPRRLLSLLREPVFLETVSAKGRLTSLCRQTPLDVITDPDIALYGAALHASGRANASQD